MHNRKIKTKITLIKLKVFMKLIRITASGLPLFKDELDLTFFAQQRVREEDRNTLLPLFSNVYLNPTNAFVGVNASGKTTVLKLILLVLDLLNNKPINHMKSKDVIGNVKRATLNAYFYTTDGNICRLESVISAEGNNSDGIVYKILEEKLWSKKAADVKTKKALTSFEGMEPVMVRDAREEFLSDDVSIMIAHNKKKKETMKVVDLLLYTNMNVLPFSEDIPAEIITFLDPTVEYLHFDKKDQKLLIYLKFKGKSEIILNNPMKLNQYLSSGTIKGMIVFTLAKEVLQSGGYIIVDEIENHFNKEIATTLMRFFMDTKLNKNGGVLIFSTHYSELLDEYDRNDSIYITRNRAGITSENLCNILERNDIKKSDAYQSGFLEGTTPMYEAYMQLRKSIAAQIN